jgi:hypothetical protein
MRLSFLSRLFYWPFCGGADPTEALRLIGKLPHPAYVRQCLREERVLEEFDELILLIETAPRAFENDGTFQSQGMIVIALLSLAGRAIRQAAWGTTERPTFVKHHRAEALRPLIESTRAIATSLADALTQRADAIPLAWAWLDRLMFEGMHRGYWRIDTRAKEGISIDPLMILVLALSERLPLRPDFAEWVEDEQTLWRIDRVLATLAVAMWGRGHDVTRVPEVLEWALCTTRLTTRNIPTTNGTIAPRKDGIPSTISVFF